MADDKNTNQKIEAQLFDAPGSKRTKVKKGIHNLI